MIISPNPNELPIEPPLQTNEPLTRIVPTPCSRPPVIVSPKIALSQSAVTIPELITATSTNPGTFPPLQLAGTLQSPSPPIQVKVAAEQPIDSAIKAQTVLNNRDTTFMIPISPQRQDSPHIGGNKRLSKNEA